MAWLSGWGKRVKCTVENEDRGDDVSNFPMLLYLSTSSGYNAEDISFVFDELQNDANCFKIAVTTSDGTTQCYVEIEKWDDANEQAWLRVKAPSIPNSTAQDFYLYYDSTHADNTDYVGDIGDRPEVWDSNFTFVNHMAEADTAEVTFTQTASAGRWTFGPCMAAISSDTVGMAGGFHDTDGVYDNFDIYTISTNSWSAKADMPAARNKPAAGVVDGIFYVLGGGSGAVGQVPNTNIWRYNSGTNDWTTMTETLDYATCYCTYVTYDDKIYVIGGYNGGTGDWHVPYIQIYDPNTDTCTSKETPLAASGLDGNAAVLTVDGVDYLYLLMAIQGNTVTYLGTLVRIRMDRLNAVDYDKDADWDTDLARFPPVECGAGSGGAWNNEFYVFGGWSWTKTAVLNGAWAYNPELDIWRVVAPRPIVSIEACLSLTAVSATVAIACQYKTNYCYKIVREADADVVIPGSISGSELLKKSASEPGDYSAGKIGYAQSFDGSNDYASSEAVSNVRFSTAMTIECWFKTTVIAPGVGIYPAVLALANPAATEFNYNLYSADRDVSNQSQFSYYSGEWYYTFGTQPASDTWKYFVGVYDAALDAAVRTKVYENGSLIEETAGPTSIPAIDQTVCFDVGMQHSTANRYFSGQVDEVRLSKIGRSTAWIKATYETERDHLLDWGIEETSGIWQLLRQDNNTLLKETNNSLLVQ